MHVIDRLALRSSRPRYSVLSPRRLLNRVAPGASDLPLFSAIVGCLEEVTLHGILRQAAPWSPHASGRDSPLRAHWPRNRSKIPPMRPVLSYTIWFSQRTGSTLLCHALESTGVAGRPGEWLTATDIPAFYARHGARTPRANMGRRYHAERRPGAKARDLPSILRCNP